MTTKLTLLAALLFAGFISTWTWYAKFSESYIYFKVPAQLYRITEKLYGCEHKEPLSMPDKDTAIGISFSVMVNKNQINPWGTIWKDTTVMKFIDGKWKYVGGGGSPKGGAL